MNDERGKIYHGDLGPVIWIRQDFPYEEVLLLPSPMEVGSRFITVPGDVPILEDVGLTAGVSLCLSVIRSRIDRAQGSFQSEQPDYLAIGQGLRVNTDLLNLGENIPPELRELLSLIKHDIRNSVLAMIAACDMLRQRGYNTTFYSILKEGWEPLREAVMSWETITRALAFDPSKLEVAGLPSEVGAIERIVHSPPSEAIGIESVTVHRGPLALAILNLSGNSLKEAKARDRTPNFHWGLRVVEGGFLCVWTTDESGGYDFSILKDGGRGLPTFGTTTRKNGPGGKGLGSISNMLAMIGGKCIITGNLLENGNKPVGVVNILMVPLSEDQR